MLGYVGAFLTAIYTFRMIFRAFYGEPCPEAEELAHGHLYHAPEPTNPATGEVEDTDVGFPGPEHHIAEREPPMKIAMGALAVLAIIGGFLQIPGVDDELHHVPRADVRGLRALRGRSSRRRRPAWIGLIVGARDRRRRHRASPAASAASGRQRRARCQARFRALHKFFVNKWYFDEVIDFLIVRPAAWLGRFANSTYRAGVRQRRAGRRHRPARSARCRPRCAASSRATCATTPRCCSSGSPA